MVDVTVVIPSYNSARTIERCIRSVFASGRDGVEVVVVDDASSDDSADRVERLRRDWLHRLRLFRLSRNGGPARARNHGARQAHGRYLFFLDSDTEMLPDALPNFLRHISQADAVVGIYDYRPLNSGLVPLYKALLNYYFFSRKGPIKYEVFDSSRAGIRRDVFDSIGGFNETLGWGMDYENEELGYRLCERYRMILDPGIAVRHEFPGFRKLTKTYFWRVALWAEIFVHRRRFESGGVTSAGTGLSSAALLLALIAAALSLLPIPTPGRVTLAILSLALLGVYLAGYAGFLAFAGRLHPARIPAFLLLNMYFTPVIAAGAGFGLLRAIVGQSRIGDKLRPPTARNIDRAVS